MTSYDPAEPLHDNVDPPEDPSVTVVGASEHVRPDDGVTDVEIDTVPVKPLTALREIVDDPTIPAFTETEVGLARRVKS